MYERFARNADNTLNGLDFKINYFVNRCNKCVQVLNLSNHNKRVQLFMFTYFCIKAFIDDLILSFKNELIGYQLSS